ncbi:hypothetical protein MJO28_017305 [Puccinia striiformis f. sp. tritici]|uniref:Uncharacterized protein n=3 Tax=Puccinia striiformis TaxID=27350 RepID=A0A0L0UZZ1_9BASI|nr:hypothetical protein MJO28_017305 [Puccinia striiformis f. sp. tritici]KNE92600.1 hypothetical protein PSTG_13986 [Puccinia striiformis f. sp. tritici PST-78]POV96601.1 hypothetical protein PSTT_15550 [Puccinia striiformis]
MALVQRITHGRVLAFTKIQQAIREDDLWTAAWCMWKFLKVPHVLSASERKMLQEEYSYRMNRVRRTVNFFTDLCFGDAKKDHGAWLKNGQTFTAVEEESLRRHEENTKVLLKAIGTYGRAAGHLRAIINMEVTLPSAQDGEVIELEAMAPSPGVMNLQHLEVPEDGWVEIRPEEAHQGDYLGQQWTTTEEWTVE